MKKNHTETGITRKTLFYYDKIGLLKPANRNGKQHGRMYSSSAIARLKTIMAYQSCGLDVQQFCHCQTENHHGVSVLRTDAEGNRCHSQSGW